jgi:hypothetical protein
VNTACLISIRKYNRPQQLKTLSQFQEISRRAEKNSSPSRRPLSPPNLQPRNLLFKSKPENNYLLNNNKDNSSSGGGVANRISQSTSGLNCLNGLEDSGRDGIHLIGACYDFAFGQHDS